MVGVDVFEIALERSRRDAELAKHETGERPVPAFQSQPAPGAGHAVANHVNVHVDPHRELIAFACVKVHFLNLRWSSITMS